MPDILPFLRSLISVSGLSGFEAPVARLIEEKWRPLVDEISTSRVGSLHGLKKGNAALDKGSENKTASLHNDRNAYGCHRHDGHQDHRWIPAHYKRWRH